MTFLKSFSIITIFLVTIVAAYYPFFHKFKLKNFTSFPKIESLATGIFLGVGLLHMLGDASSKFYSLHIYYPLAFLLAGVIFLFLLLLEHISRELYYGQKTGNKPFAILAVFMLSVHSFLTGTALGFTHTCSKFLLLFLAVLFHKWAESLSLAVEINKSNLGLKSSISLFIVFALMVPLGVIFASEFTATVGNYSLITPIVTSLSAGTFIYLGTLHGLDKSVLVKECCNLKRFIFVIIGFLIMAVVAIYT